MKCRVRACVFRLKYWPILTAGDEGPVALALERCWQCALRRRKHVDDKLDYSIQRVGLTMAQVEEMYRHMAIVK
jgi:nitrate reductase beta subunit